MTVPTVDQIIGRYRIGCGLCFFPVEGGSIQITEAELRQALDDAYDAADPDWVSFVEIEA